MDRITAIRIENVRAIEKVNVAVSRPLTVLIGENGSGKSTIIECLEILRKAAEPRFLQQFYAQHRGMPGLLRRGADDLTLGVSIDDDEGKLPPLDYAFTLRPQAAGAVVTFEQLLQGERGGGRKRLTAIQRGASKAKVYLDRARRLDDMPEGGVVAEELLAGSFGNQLPNEAVRRLLAALRGIEVHPAFDTLAAWAVHSMQWVPTMRGTSMLLPAEHLSLLGQNLASVWQTLKNLDEAHWRETMALVRLGLGDEVDSVNTYADAGGGHVGLSLKRSDLSEPIPATSLSDGQLTWLALVALVRLHKRRTLLAVDEPDLHLHPHLVGGVVALLSDLDVPVVMATHSDRVLSLLDDPAHAVRVCGLGAGARAEVARLDARELEKWLREYGDLGRLRDAGYLSRVLAEDAAAVDGGDE